ncbi:MAG TPA: porin, partial [Blastocatellia bacterium]|nr:porin [Blastocatellia bacterium]
MRIDKKPLLLQSLAMMVLLLVLVMSAHAQERKEERVEADPGQSGDLYKLKSKLEQLEVLVETQQRALAEMQKRLDEGEGKARTAALVLPAGLEGVTGEARPASLETGQTPAGAAPGQEKQKAADKPALLAGWDRNHAFLRSADGSFETQLTGYAQLDHRSYESGNHPPNTFLMRRARLALEGKLARYFDFKIEGDFADVVGTLLRDAYVNVHRIDEFQLRFGQFRVPISQEEIRSDAFQDFVERSMVNNLAPSRSPGLMASGVIKKGVFEYQVGAFNGRGLLGVNTTGTPETAVRLRF